MKSALVFEQVVFLVGTGF